MNRYYQKYNQTVRVSLLITVLIMAASCCKEEDPPESVIIGETTVDLNANPEIVRTGEAVIGNLISDAIFTKLKQDSIDIDFYTINGGNIRFDSQIRPDGIYSSGPITNAMVDQMLPFGNFMVIVTLTGADLKAVMERSVSVLPLARGWFLQLSENVKVKADLSKQPQIIDETVFPPVIQTQGERIVSLQIKGEELDSLAIYRVGFNSFIAEGNDGYVTLGNIRQDRKQTFEELETAAVKEYIILNTPVSPQLENRIELR